MPAWGQRRRLDNTRDLFATDLNNLCGRGFGTCIAHQDVNSRRLLLGRFGSREALCSSFSCSLVSGSGGIACCGTARHSISPAPFDMACG